jgi:hypothetical protein
MMDYSAMAKSSALKDLANPAATPVKTKMDAQPIPVMKKPINVQTPLSSAVLVVPQNQVLSKLAMMV